VPTYNIRWTKAVSEQWEYSKIEERMNRTQRQNHKYENIGLVFNVQKFSIHDGKGIRTLIFLKGCPLRCGWCSNPEGQSYSPELAYNPEKCIGISECGRCIQVCKEGAIEKNIDGKILVDRKLWAISGFVKGYNALKYIILLVLAPFTLRKSSIRICA